MSMKIAKETEMEGTEFVNEILKAVFKPYSVKNAGREDSVEEAARIVMTFKQKTLFDANGKLAKPTTELVGRRIRSVAVSEYSAVDVKMTHSDRVNGEPSEFERMASGTMRYFVQTYAGKDYVVLDVQKMRALELFKDETTYNVIERSSNGGAYKYAEFPLKVLFNSGVVVAASEAISAFFA
jgi:hypothetical protein